MCWDPKNGAGINSNLSFSAKEKSPNRKIWGLFLSFSRFLLAKNQDAPLSLTLQGGQDRLYKINWRF